MDTKVIVHEKIKKLHKDLFGLGGNGYSCPAPVFKCEIKPCKPAIQSCPYISSHSGSTWSYYLILILHQLCVEPVSLVQRPLFRRMKQGQQCSWPNEVEAHEWGCCNVDSLLIAHCTRSAWRELKKQTSFDETKWHFQEEH